MSRQATEWEALEAERLSIIHKRGEIMRSLFTIGYEGADLADFLATLKRRKIHLLLDVREFPLSRRKGFSKSVLREALASEGIQYRHEKRLGSPKAIRQKLYKDGDYEAFFLGFGEHLQRQQGLVEQLAEELTGNVVLMCYEKNHEVCHRSAVVAALAALVEGKPIHLHVDGDETRKAPEATYMKSRNPHRCGSVSPGVKND